MFAKRRCYIRVTLPLVHPITCPVGRLPQGGGIVFRDIFLRDERRRKRSLRATRPARQDHRHHRCRSFRAALRANGRVHLAYRRSRETSIASLMILLDSLVNVSPVSDVVQVNPALAQIEFVNDSVIAYAQFEFSRSPPDSLPLPSRRCRACRSPHSLHSARPSSRLARNPAAPLKLTRVPACSPLLVTALPSMSLIPSAPFASKRCGSDQPSSRSRGTIAWRASDPSPRNATAGGR